MNQLTKADVEGSVPVWARTTTGTRPWADVKAAVQRDFVSGTRKGFRVLVATKAFGMGIDKPSIRKVITWVAPPSPKAFYPKFAPTGVERKSSNATVLSLPIPLPSQIGRRAGRD